MPKMWRVIQQQKFTLGSIMRARRVEKIINKKSEETMKNILFFENSLSLHKAIKLILGNEKIYSVEIVENIRQFETEISKKKFDLLIANYKLIFSYLDKKTRTEQNILFLYENEDNIKDLDNIPNYYFIEKPFASNDFKVLVNNILQIREENMKEPIHIDITSSEMENYMKNIIDKWVKEQAPKYAKDIIREEIIKLIS